MEVDSGVVKGLDPRIQKSRTALFCERIDDENDMVEISLVVGLDGYAATDPVARVSLKILRDPTYDIDAPFLFIPNFGDRKSPAEREAQSKQSRAYVVRVLGSLLVINSRRGFAKKTHDPHKGVSRLLRGSEFAAGKFPLHAWTEIVLKPLNGQEAKETATQITGEKSRHYVRQFYRTPSDRAPHWVTDHWRGDAALGIKRSDYVVR